MAEIYNEQLVAPLKDKFQSWGVKYGLLDLDGTQLDTVSLFKKYMRQFATDISQKTGFLVDEVSDFMGKALEAIRPELSVHPGLMEETARLTSQRFGLDYYGGEVDQEVDNLMKLYTSAPEAFDGVHQTLDLFRSAGVESVVVTHSDRPRTDDSLAKNRLLEYYRGRIFSFQSRGSKGVSEWSSVFDALGVTPLQVFGAGDNWERDIGPLIKLGVPKERVFRVATSYRNANIGAVSGVTQINTFADLPMAILSQ